MTILLVHNFYKIPGGEDTAFYNEKALLEANGHRVLTYTRSNGELSSLNLLQKLLFPAALIFRMRTYVDIKRIIRRENVDIVHVHNTLALISPAVYYAAKACGVKAVQTIHNFRMVCPNALLYRNGKTCTKCLKHGPGSALVHRCYRGSFLQTLGLVCSMIIHRCTGIYRYPSYICLTEWNRRILLKQGQIPQGRVFVKPNPIGGDTAKLNSQMSEDPVGHERSNQILYAGRLEDAKGIREVLFAFEKLQREGNPKLVICGSGPLEEWCREYIADHALNAEFLGQVSNDEVVALMSKSRAMIFASKLHEGLPMSILEAYSVGTPVICADHGNGGSLVSEGVTGWKFAPGDVDGICEAIRKSRDISGAVYSEYEQKYSPRACYSKLMEIYRA